MLVNKITRVFLSNLLNLDEKIIFLIAKKHKIEINFFEEGFSLYTNPHWNQYDNITKKITHKFKNLLKNIYALFFSAKVLLSSMLQFTNLVQKGVMLYTQGCIQ